MKNIPFRWHTIVFIGIFVVACVVRSVLVANSWPLSNSDEGTVGIMAMHILQGDRPIFLYGQNYLGMLEAYLGALIFNLAGVSLFALRLGMILLFLGFMAAMYALTRLLYTRNLALFTVLLLALGSNAVFARELNASGGYMETILCAALAFFLAAWLAFVAADTRKWYRSWRIAGYAAWGLAVGLGLWSDLLILPAALCALLILVIFCWRDLLKGALFPLLIGLVLGAFPLIFYNLGAAPGRDSWSNLVGQQGSSALSALPAHLLNTVETSIPTISGSPFCRVSEQSSLRLLGFEQSVAPTLLCHFVNTSWSLTCLLLLVISSCAALAFLWRYGRSRLRPRADSARDRQEFIRQTARLLLIASAVLTLVAYIRSTAPEVYPAILSRYLNCLWIVLPALLWPLWIGATRTLHNFSQKLALWIAPATKIVCRGVLLLLLCFSLFGTVVTLREIPAARAAETQEDDLVQGLLSRHITHIYTEYWVCDRVAFQSHERVICAVLSLGNCPMPPVLDAHNRYRPYAVVVSQDPFASYMLSGNSPCNPAVARYLQQAKIAYREFKLQGYIVYQPWPAS